MSEVLLKMLASSDWTPGGVGIWVLVVMVFGYITREIRANRKLSVEDRDALRAGYATQVQNLMTENRALGADMQSLRANHDAYRKQCQTETDQLRGMVINLENEVEGLKRRAANDAIEIVRLKGVSR